MTNQSRKEQLLLAINALSEGKRVRLFQDVFLSVETVKSINYSEGNSMFTVFYESTRKDTFEIESKIWRFHIKENN